jgi:exosortase
MKTSEAENNRTQEFLSSRYLCMLLLAGSFVVLYYGALCTLVKDWSEDPNFSHGFIVPLVSGFIIWKERANLRMTVSKSANAGLLVIFLSMVLFVVGDVGAERFTRNLSLVLTIAGLFYLYLGGEAIRKFWFPIVYLLFMIPIPAILWNQAAFPMQLLASRISFNVVQALDVSVIREGNILLLPSITLEVVDACSGIRSLTSLLALSAAFAYFSGLRAPYKWWLFGSAVPIAVGANAFRLSATAVIAEIIGPEIAMGFLHELSGILVFLIALFALGLTNRLLSIIEKSLRPKVNLLRNSTDTQGGFTC